MEKKAKSSSTPQRFQPLPLRWIDLHVTPEELRLDATIHSGQCFNWARLPDVCAQLETDTSDQEHVQTWIGMVAQYPLAIRQRTHTTEYALLNADVSRSSSRDGASSGGNSSGSSDTVDEEQLSAHVRDYFQLQHNLPALYSEWAQRCARMKIVTDHLKGLRVIRQDPWECLISFICSSNNNIPRIAMMLHRLRYHYGAYTVTLNPIQTRDEKDSQDLKDPLRMRWYVSYDEEKGRKDLVLFNNRTPQQGFLEDTGEAQPVESVLVEDQNYGREIKSEIKSKIKVPKAKAPPVPMPTPIPTHINGKLVIQTPAEMAKRNKGKIASSASPSQREEKEKEKSFEKEVGVVLDMGVDVLVRHVQGQEKDLRDFRGSLLSPIDLYTFPTAEALASASEADLRALGMGYRAKFLIEAAKQVQSKHPDGAEAWFQKLRDQATQLYPSSYRSSALRGSNISSGSGTGNSGSDSSSGSSRVKAESTIEDGASIVKQEPTEVPSTAQTGKTVETEDGVRLADARRLHVQSELCSLLGVGRKVADCVALFSLDQSSCIPVDTHVWSIVNRDYFTDYRPPVKGKGEATTGQLSSGIIDIKSSSRKSGISSSISKQELDVPKSLTPAVYEAIGAAFRQRFGPRAGWAQSVLFAAELPLFSKQLPVPMQQEMKAFAELQRTIKSEKKESAKKTNASEREKISPTRTRIKEEINEEKSRTGVRVGGNSDESRSSGGYNNEGDDGSGGKSKSKSRSKKGKAVTDSKGDAQETPVRKRMKKEKVK